MKNKIFKVIGFSFALSYTFLLTWFIFKLFFLGSFRIYEYSRAICVIEVISGIVAMIYLISQFLKDAK